MNNGRFVYVTYIAASPRTVWDALREGESARQFWKCEIASDWVPGATWQLLADDAGRSVLQIGRVLECVAEKRLVLSWGNVADGYDGPAMSRVAIDIEPAGAKVRLTVTHEDLDADMERRISGGWPLVLSSLKSFIETGEPLAFEKCAGSAAQAVAV